MKNFNLNIHCFSKIICLSFLFSTFSSLLIAQEVFKIPGKIFSNYGQGQTLKLEVTKVGNYEFSIKNPERKINEHNMMTGKDFRNKVKMVLLNEQNDKIESNYFSGSRRNVSEMGKMEARHLDSFNASFKATGTYYLKLSPLNEKEANRKYLLKADYKGKPFLIWGMKWHDFLTAVAALVAVLFVGFIVIVIWLSIRRQAKEEALEKQQNPRESEDESAANEQPETNENVGEVQSKKEAEKFCPACGTPREEDADFCANCGHKFTSNSQ